MSILLIPCSSEIPIANYERTIEKTRTIDELRPDVKTKTLETLKKSGHERFCIWGLAFGDRNKKKFEELRDGDKVVFCRNFTGSRRIIGTGTVVAKEDNERFGEKLWRADDEGRTFTLLFYIVDCFEIDSTLNAVEMGYDPDFNFRGSMMIRPGTSQYNYLKKKIEVSGRRIC